MDFFWSTTDQLPCRHIAVTLDSGQYTVTPVKATNPSFTTARFTEVLYYSILIILCKIHWVFSLFAVQILLIQMSVKSTPKSTPLLPYYQPYHLSSSPMHSLDNSTLLPPFLLDPHLL